MHSAAAAYREGDILAGKYRVERVLGAGGMGVVLAAVHVELRERRAIKLMNAQGLEDPVYVERFLREARALARLRGEHIARVHDVGRLENGVPYMVIEYLEGTDLGQVLEKRRLSVDEAVLFVLQVCEALAEAHAAGIIHRDLKPENLFLTRDLDGSPHIKVIDFGIAKTVAGDATQQHATHHQRGNVSTKTGSWMGSPLYMSPEQIQTSRDVDARVDVWALGAVLHELLTSQPVWPGIELLEIFYQITMTSPTPPSKIVPGLPPGLDAVVLRCLEKDRNRRWENVAELADALEPFASREGKALVRRITRILVGRLTTVRLGTDTPIPPDRASAPTMAAPVSAANTPLPLPLAAAPLDRAASSSLAATPVSFATNSPNTASGARKQTWLISAIVGVAALLLTGIAVYVLRGDAKETAAPASSVFPEQAQAPIPEGSVGKDPLPEKIAPVSIPETSVVPVQHVDAPVPSTPNPTAAAKVSKPRASAVSTATTSPEKPRPGVIPR